MCGKGGDRGRSAEDSASLLLGGGWGPGQVHGAWGAGQGLEAWLVGQWSGTHTLGGQRLGFPSEETPQLKGRWAHCGL